MPVNVSLGQSNSSAPVVILSLAEDNSLFMHQSCPGPPRSAQGDYDDPYRGSSSCVSSNYPYAGKLSLQTWNNRIPVLRSGIFSSSRAGHLYAAVNVSSYQNPCHMSDKDICDPCCDIADDVCQTVSIHLPYRGIAGICQHIL